METVAVTVRCPYRADRATPVLPPQRLPCTCHVCTAYRAGLRSAPMDRVIDTVMEQARQYGLVTETSCVLILVAP